MMDVKVVWLRMEEGYVERIEEIIRLSLMGYSHVYEDVEACNEYVGEYPIIMSKEILTDEQQEALFEELAIEKQEGGV